MWSDPIQLKGHVLLKITIFILCLQVNKPLVGQEQFSQSINFTADDGLPSMEAYCIVEDQKGYIWTGTSGGLARFNGYEFETYSPKDGLTNNNILDLKTDSSGRIWISSFGRLVYYKDTSFFATTLPIPKSSSLSIRHKSIGDDVYITVNRNLYRFKTSSGDLEPFPLSEELQEINKKYPIILDMQDDALWFFVDQSFIKFVDDRVVDKIPIKYELTSTNSFQAQKHKGHIYYESIEGIIGCNVQTGEQFVLDYEIKDPRRIKIIDNCLWIVSNSQGVFRIEVDEEGKCIKKEIFFKGEAPSDILKDKEGNFWISTSAGGIFFIPAQALKIKLFDERDGFSTNKLEGILHHDSCIYIGSSYATLEEFHAGRIKSIPIPNLKNKKTDRILHINKLPSGALLLGKDLGLTKYYQGEIVNLVRHSIKTLYVHQDNRVLLNTHNGAYLTDLSFLDSVPGLLNIDLNFSIPRFRKIYFRRCYGGFIDRHDQIWLGSASDGLLTLKDTFTFKWSTLDPVFNAHVEKIIQINDGIIAMATNGEGLLFVKDRSYFQIDVEKGLSSNLCNDIIFQDGDIWVATNKGLSVVRDFNFEKKTFLLSSWDKTDGLVSNDVFRLLLHNDELYATTHDGLMVVNTADLTKNRNQPSVYITDISVNGYGVNLSETLNLEHFQNNIEINFVGISYRSMGNLRYEYRLIGFEDTWVQTRSLDAHYSNLPPGNYTFLVRALDRHGGEHTETAQLFLTIDPHFTQTVLFQLIFYAGIFIFLLFLLFSWANQRQRIQLKKLVDEKTEALNKQVDILEATNVKLKQSNQELQQFAHVASHDLKSPLRNVASFIQLLKRRNREKLDKEGIEYIDFAVKGVKHMEEIINDLLMIAKVDRTNADKYEVDFGELVEEVLDDLDTIIRAKNAKIKIAKGMPTLFFSRINAKQLFQNLISNALKYQEQGIPKIKIGYGTKGSNWLFYVKDNGIGIEDKYREKVFEMFQRLHQRNEYSGTGIGLAICKKIIERNHGEIWFESELHKGTTFFFTLPKNPSNNIDMDDFHPN